MAWSEAARRAAIETRKRNAKGKKSKTHLKNGLVRMGSLGKTERYIMGQGWQAHHVHAWARGASPQKQREIQAAFKRVQAIRAKNQDPYSHRSK